MAFLVTGGTGHQGGAVARQLLELGYRVHILTRDSSSKSAQSLQNRGAVLFQGSFTDKEVIHDACVGVQGVFLNVYPTPENWQNELQHARNIIDAAEKSGISAIIYSGMVLIPQHELFPDWPDYPHSEFFLSKYNIENIIRTSKIPYFSILRPAFLMQNFLHPACSVFYPDLVSRHVIQTALPASMPYLLVDAEDVGKFSVKIFQEPEKFHRQEIELGGEFRTVEEISQRMSETLGVKIDVEHVAPEITKSMLSIRPLFRHEILMTQMFEHLHITPIEHGIKMNTIEDFLARDKVALVKVLTLEN